MKERWETEKNRRRKEEEEEEEEEEEKRKKKKKKKKRYRGRQRTTPVLFWVPHVPGPLPMSGDRHGRSGQQSGLKREEKPEQTRG